MAIQMRRGNSADYDPTKLRAGEFAVSQDNQKIYICVSQGNVLEVATGSNLQQWIVQSEAWAVGEKNGVPVPSTDETYHNNSKYYAGIASAASLNPPYIGLNGNWYTYDTATEQYVDSGIDASITVDIADVTMLPTGSSPYVTNTGTSTDAIFHFFLPNSKGITSIVKTDTQGLVDTYTITYSDSTTSTFTVTNGADGQDGADGADGRGITSITRTASVGLDDIYTISYTDSTTSQYTVRNGCQWYTGTGISGKSPTPTVFPSSGVTNANLHDLYLNTTECAVYQCEYDGAPSVAKWAYICTIKGDSGTGDMNKAVYDPSNHGYVDKAAGVTDGINVLSYSDILNGLGGGNAEEIVRDTVGWTGKNLAEVTAQTYTLKGITFTVNPDKSVTIDGTSTEDWVTISLTDHIILPAGSYVLSGISGGSISTYRLTISQPPADDVNVYDGEVEYTIAANTQIRINLTVRTSGTTVNNVTVYPMLRKADILDSTYEPYHATVENYMLPQSVMNVMGAKNVFYIGDIISGSSLTTISGTSVKVKNTTAADWQNAVLRMPVEKNTDYTFTTSIDYASGVGGVSIRDKNSTGYVVLASEQNITSDKTVKLTFNSQNYESIVICLFSTYGTSETGEVDYNNCMLRPAEFTDETYEPYAMTNKQLTDAVGCYIELAASSATTYTFTDSRITADSRVDVYTDTYGDNPTNVVCSAGSCTVTFSAAQSRTVGIEVK